MLNDDERMVQETARRFAREKLAPFARQWDAGAEVPTTLWREMGALGFFGLLGPKAYGGLEASFLSWIVAVEEIAAGDGGVSTLMHVHSLGTAAPIAHFGSDAQKARWLPAMLSGESIGCIGLTEPHAGSDLASARTRARKVEGGWKLDGVKQFITNAVRADVAIVLAVTAPDRGAHGMSFFLVPRGAPGFLVGKAEEKLGQKSSDTAQLVFEDCFVPDDAVLGTLHQAFPLAMSLLSDGRISIAAQAIGMARAAFEHALAYAKERRSFGKALIDHQAIAFRLADMATQIEAARAFTHAAARLLDAKVDCVKEASMTKLFAGEMAEKVCSDAIQIHGGYGYLKDYPVERIYRDVRVCQIYEGTNDIQRLIIARKLKGQKEEGARQ